MNVHGIRAQRQSRNGIFEGNGRGIDLGKRHVFVIDLQLKG
jgi:hypothetical protein